MEIRPPLRIAVLILSLSPECECVLDRNFFLNSFDSVRRILTYSVLSFCASVKALIDDRQNLKRLHCVQPVNLHVYHIVSP